MQCESVTPEDDGAIPLLADVLTNLGFICEIVEFEEDGFPAIKNLYAKFGKGKKNLCFAGHTDVVPPGDIKAWKFPPFSPIVSEEKTLW